MAGLGDLLDLEAGLGDLRTLRTCQSCGMVCPPLGLGDLLVRQVMRLLGLADLLWLGDRPSQSDSGERGM